MAKRLAKNLRICFYELDYIAWEEGHPEIERPLQIQLRDIYPCWSSIVLRDRDQQKDFPWSHCQTSITLTS